jgi:hypothetical protein
MDRPSRLITAVAALGLLAGCAGGSDPGGGEAATDVGWIGGAPRFRADVGTDGREALAAVGGDGDESAIAYDTAAGTATGSGASTGAATVAGSTSAAAPDEQQPGLGLRAGSVDDNEQWEAYLRYRDLFLASGIPVHDIPVAGRQVVTVVTPDGAPVLGALVELRVGDGDGDVVARARTAADGTAYLLPPVSTDGGQQQGGGGTGGYRAVVTKAGARAEIDLPPGARTHQIELDADGVDEVALDVLFLIDTTGSMGDEIERLKAHMVSVAERIAELPARPDVRFALTVYRDRGDAFVAATRDFTEDVAGFVAALREVQADGGGDTPEDLNAGFHSALTEPSWRGDDAVKLVFLVADAPPHLDYDGPDYAEDVLLAAERGVIVHAVASSGLDDQGEFVFRQLAQVTGGRFVFLTYGADGASPGDETTHHVDDYSVLALDDLVVHLVSEELEPLAR